MSKFLTHQRAVQRFNQIAPEAITYNFHVKLLKGNTYQGYAQAEFSLSNVDTDLFYDFSGKEILTLIINNTKVQNIVFDGGFITLQKQHLFIGKNNTIIIYRNSYDNDGNGCVSFTDVDGKQYLYTQFEPYFANRVFPLFDQPDLKSSMKLNILSPSQWRVLSNEKATIYKAQYNQELYISNIVTSNIILLKNWLGGYSGTITLHPQTKKLPTYLFCFVAGQYSQLVCPNPYKNIPMSLYCIQSLVEYLQKLAPFIWQVTIQSMKFFQQFFGYPFSFNKYQQIFAHQYKWGAMENAGIVTFNDLYVWKQKVSNQRMLSLANTISHQLAHHWFGNLVTMKWWDDLWLNQSFADFISHFCLQKIKQKITTLKYDSSMTAFNSRKGWGYHQDQMITTHPISGPVANTLVAQSIFDGITYSKGAATMKQLLFLMGQNNFSLALSQYFHKFQWKNTVLSDFISSMQNHFHNQNFTLQEWKKVWLQKACLNQIQPKWDCNCHQIQSKLIINQTAVLPEHPTLRMHKIRVGFFKEDCTVDIIQTLIYPKQQNIVSYNGENKYKALLLNYQDHSFVKHLLDINSVDFFATNLYKINDLLSRTLIWRTFYDMVKDSKITSQKYIQIFINNIEKETYDGIFEKQFDMIHASINSFTPAKYRDNLNQKIFSFNINYLKNIDSNSSNRIVILKNKIVQFATTQNAKKILLKWKNNQYQALSAYPMTLGQQWSAVVKAFTLKSLTNEQKEQYFSSQALIDSSDTMKNKRQICDSLIANKQKFEQLYQSYKSKQNPLSTSLKGASMRGWNKIYHQQWLLQYRTRYFADIIYVSQNLNTDNSLAFLENLQPVNDDLENILNEYEKLMQQLKKYDRVYIETRKIVDNLKRRIRTYQLFENTQAKL